MSKKSIMKINDIGELEHRILEHRLEYHNTADTTIFFDCSGCGVLEARLRYLQSKEVYKNEP